MVAIDSLEGPWIPQIHLGIKFLILIPHALSTLIDLGVAVVQTCHNLNVALFDMGDTSPSFGAGSW